MTAKKILLVDDDKDLLYGMKIWLRANGFQVCYVSDAASAIAMAKAHRPDLIVLDTGLPGGDGYMTMGRLRTLMPLTHTPIIVISARDHRRKALEAGAEAFFQKPFDNRQLLAAIQKALAPQTTLPPQEGEASKKTIAEAREKKILLIGEDQELLHGLRIRLRSCGFDVHLAPNAPLGVQVAQKTRPDLVILDVGRPGGDGYRNLARLRSHMPLAHVPMIIITATGISTSQERALKPEVEAFFQKPIDNQQLLAAIQSALGEVSVPVTGSSLGPHPANR
jgi:DNA-binding response OmpR family regulator